MALATVPPKTYLEICQDIARECGVSGTAAGDVPKAVTGQVGELQRIVKWVQSCWRDIQGHRHWSWMWEEAPLVLPLDASVIDAVSAGNVSAERYLVDTAQRTGPLTSMGWNLEYVAWDDWKNWFNPQDIAAGNAPTVFTIRPDNSLAFNGLATAANGGAMAFTIERYKNPTQLVLPDDVPEMPADLHDLIVYKGIVRYANFDEAGVTRSTAVTEVARLEADLIRRCLPEIRLGGPLTDE